MNDKKVIEMNFEKQIRMFETKSRALNVFYDWGIYFHPTFVWKRSQ